MTLRSPRPSSKSSRNAMRFAVALTLGCAASAPAHAFRMAHSRIVSAPNAPLQVLVGISELTPDEQRSLMASLADPSAWEQAGVTPPVPLSSMTLRLEGGGNPTRRNLRISSPEAAKSRVVDLLLNVGTSEGQRQVQVSMMQSAGGFPGLTSQAQVGSSASPGRGAGAVAVRPGDTLYGIAQSNAIAGATLYQMLVALWRANPNAFIQNNMNLVKAGVTLVVPDAATVRAIDPAEARRIFIQQQEAYARYRASLAGAAARGAAASAAGSTSAGQVGGAQTPVTPEAPPQDRLRLSSGQAGQGSAEAQAQAQADAQTSIAKASQDAQQRVDQLERNVKDLNDALAERGAQQGGAGGAQTGGTGADAAGKGQSGGFALPGLGGAASGAAGTAGGRPGALAQAGSAAQPGAGTSPGSAGSPGSAAPSGGATQPGAAAQSGAATPSGTAQQGATAPAGGTGAGTQAGAGNAATQANGAAATPGAATQGAAHGAAGQSAAASGAATPGAATPDASTPGISGDATNLGTPGTAGASGSAAGGASAQTGGAASGSPGTGITPSGAGAAPGAPGAGSTTGINPTTPNAATGASGATGAPGAPGANGATGATGANGANGANGPASAGSGAAGESAITVGPGTPSTDAGSGAKNQDATSGLPSWLSDNLLIILTAVLALVAFVIAWLLRRAAVRREEDQDDFDDELYMSEIDQRAIDRRLDGINLDLDEPPVEGDRRPSGPVRT
ncbi:hypothetical protein CAL26_09495 [Bordetella genomosp. 9]|uniref:LysM domain-containing protein n=1 Tax=Bordetella genomosp. 9 TaxID=1416803 RepID=A0A261RGA6_9BORD|nr:FimV/HubP family polar landmark protein [Bordetella genomosp. 9]OZI23660.1 hypothetical protein CAL26_09495 [Bordetella genomosp. 9]